MDDASGMASWEEDFLVDSSGFVSGTSTEFDDFSTETFDVDSEIRWRPKTN